MLDNLETLFSSGVSVIRTLELTADVIDSEVFRQILLETIEEIKTDGVHPILVKTDVSSEEYVKNRVEETIE